MCIRDSDRATAAAANPRTCTVSPVVDYLAWCQIYHTNSRWVVDIAVCNWLATFRRHCVHAMAKFGLSGVAVTRTGERQRYFAMADCRAKDGAALGVCVVVHRFTTPRDRYACRHPSMSIMSMVESVLDRSSSMVVAPGGGASVLFLSFSPCCSWVQWRISFPRR